MLILLNLFLYHQNHDAVFTFNTFYAYQLALMIQNTLHFILIDYHQIINMPSFEIFDIHV